MNTLDIPLLDQLPAKYQGPALLAAMLLPYLTRAYHALAAGGGLRGIWSAIWFGTNTPKPAADQPGPGPVRVLPIFLCLGLVVALPACVTTPEGKTVPDVALMQSVAHDAAFLGTTFYLQAKPQDRLLFQMARNSLATLIAAGEFSPDQLTAAFAALPIKTLQSQQGTLIIGAAVSLWDAYGRQLATLDKDQVFPTYVLPVAKSILAGLDLALAPPLPPTPTATK